MSPSLWVFLGVVVGAIPAYLAWHRSRKVDAASERSGIVQNGRLGQQLALESAWDLIATLKDDNREIRDEVKELRDEVDALRTEIRRLLSSSGGGG